ncbi:UDP-2,4-diacetamido-2,4,6-trideoxy-beta-L-altropyranose hydrolase [Chitinibacter sp. GC72]|uniref:UDP-2,4-diacetamido-2,4, 6-trideoxy-beta-L-altropyranose hydrolase n=1 Tax=Chitinibacter sp. GC72 TaxID=1526917 RepID=UPI0012F96C37|nr:UDP-2,4-diacetamido-2,4,6-trideoxy-beta-L-altropyranose hydrolase [Chitinibacter sp. GC72]
MKVLIRADASSTIGAGHVMRCLTLAAALRKCHVEVTFACADLAGHIIDTVYASGFEVVSLHGLYPLDWQAEVQELQTKLDVVFDWLIVDHYQLDWEWERAIRHLARRIMVIDDLCNRRHDADILLDQNLCATPQLYQRWLSKSCRLLLGARFVLLRPEFAEFKVAIKPELTRIVVNFGAADPSRELFKVMDALQDCEQFTVDFIAGCSNSAWSELQQRVGLSPRWRLHQHIEHLAQFIAEADLFIGAAGSSSWERALIGLPSICIAVADNQVKPAQVMQDRGMHVYLGESRAVSAKVIQQHLLALTLTQRQSLSTTSIAAIDAHGVERVVAALMQFELQIRLATNADAQLIFDARNAPEVRRHSMKTAVIEWDSHCLWLERQLVNTDSLLLIGSAFDGEVGVVRFDRCDQSAAEVSIYLLSKRLGLGWGQFLLKNATDYLRQQWPTIKSIKAKIKKDNLPSIKLFSCHGYQCDGAYYVHSL